MVINNGATIDNNGKIGKCYSFGTGNSYIVIDSTPLKTFTEFSFACWVKIISWNTNYSTIFAAKNSTSTSWNNLIFSLLRSGGNPNLCFNISNGTSYTATNCYTGVLSLNTWYHIVCTYEEGKIKLYQDGNIVNTYNTTVIPNFDSIANLWIGKSNENTYQSNNLLNDVRIYDHALSPLEVKQISQGLVLHYPLNRNGWGQENLLLNTQILTPNSSTTTKNCSQRGSAVRQLRTDGFYEAKCTSAWQGLSTWANAQNLIVGQKYTYSFYFYTDGSIKSLSFYPMMFNSSGTRDTSSTLLISVDGSGYQSVNSRTFGNFSNSTPIKHYIIFEWNNTMASIISNGGTIELSIQVHGTFNSGEYGCVYAPKLEVGDKMTPWCPNSSDTLATAMGLNDNIQYDTSGYGNNGTKNNSPTYSSDTVKYNISTHLDGVNQTIQLPKLTTLTPDSIFTFNIWFKRLSAEPSSKPWETILGGPSGFELETCSANNVHDNKVKAYSWGGGTFEFELDKWNMLTMVSNGANALFYLNGNLKLTGTYKALVSGNYFIGSWRDTTSQNYKGYVSDVRIYATALSAEDVKSLYNNSAYIDNQGNIYGAVYEEV